MYFSCMNVNGHMLERKLLKETYKDASIDPRTFIVKGSKHTAVIHILTE